VNYHEYLLHGGANRPGTCSARAIVTHLFR
jgi:hypothetical protein